jgi:LysR family transcriptional activator of nhaA
MSSLERINYNHLFYFWTVAREGGLLPAARALRVSHPTLSVQLHALEEQLGEKLMVKAGRSLVVTEAGRLVYRYADEMFSLGREMTQSLAGQSPAHMSRLRAGIVDVVPKLVVRRLLQAALALPDPVRLVCHEDSHERLLAELATHSLDLLISDEAVSGGSAVRAFNHLLGDTSVSVFGARSLANAHRRDFPASLNGAPLLLPLDGSTFRRSLNQWFERNRIEPRVVAEFEDSALLKVFGADGVGLFFAPTVVASEIVRQYEVDDLGELPEVRERFYVISAERRLKHPAVVAITESARRDLFS